MKKLIVTILIFQITASALYATRISDVKVDFVKGYTKGTLENGDSIYYYMGRVSYVFFAEGKDSVYVDFKVAPKGTENWLQIHELTGDIGLVKQKNGADTLKTAYFRTSVVKDFSGEYVGVILATAENSVMWRMADSIGRLMSLDQRQWTLYTNMTHPVYAFFGQDTYLLPDGTPIVGWRCADGPHGTRYPLGGTNEFAIYGAGDTATLFPTEAALGCTWDPDLTYRIGAAIGKEARARGVYCILGPMCDLVINPRWGRAFETMSEDPYLCGKMTASQSMGLQSVNVIACPKHFTPYVTETSRGMVRIVVEERALRELFCEPFRIAIQEGGARAIMTCYHHIRVPGFTVEEPVLLNQNCDRAGSNRHLINDILRNDWGFDGIIMTDWQGADGVEPTYSYETEYDMSMPEGRGGFQQIANNIRSGFWSEEPLNRKVKRIMYQKLWAWGWKLLKSDDEIKTYPMSVIVCKEHQDLSLEAARKSITLVKNDPVDGSPILPLDKNAKLKIAVVGPYAKIPRPGGGGSSVVTPDKIVTLLQGMQEYSAAHPNITITEDYNNVDAAVVCVGVDRESEDYDRPSMVLPDIPVPQNNLVASVMAKVKKTVVVYTGGSASTAGKWSEAPAIIVAFYPGRVQGQAMAEAIFGEFNPGGHLNVTFPKSESDLPSYDQVDYFLKLTSADTAHGYFFYEKTGKKPLFWFGHGLSYTTFRYEDIRLVGSSSISAGDRIDVVVTITNTGELTGDDVVQLYVKPKGGPIPRRVKDLRGFKRVTLAPKESKKITFTLGPRDFSVYKPDPSTKSGKWEVVPGEYDIIAGSTSDPAVLTGQNGLSVIASLTVN